MMFFLLFLSLLSPDVAKASKLKMIYFYDKNCIWCKHMNEVLSDPVINSLLSRNAEILRVDIKSTHVRDRELISTYGIRSVPTIVFINDRYKELLRVPGAIMKRDFFDLLCENLDEISKERECLNR